ncbi:MAG: hypothetical protein H8D45_13800 [Bacteroidetes bacterium]|nr:hypothetical protein [Bacteroidota bacterium]MBL7104787.1 hypothetical protein [Bacteroidales bacterium]
MKTEPMKVHYLCPNCRSYLRVWNNIIFTVKSAEGKKQGLLLLNPEVGNYTYVSHPSLKFFESEKVEFFCPVCFSNLTAKQINENLVKIIMVDEQLHEFDIYFSKIAGQHATFKIAQDNIIERHGEHSSSYVNYFMSKLRENLGE